MSRTVFSVLTMILALMLVIPLLVMIFPVWLFVSLCIALEKRLVSSNRSLEQIIKFDPDIGWIPRANLNKVYYYDQSGDRGSIVTDDDGWPCKYTIEESDVVIFGDSFAFGYGSDFENTYYGLNKEIRIKPIAAPSYNMVQGLLLMKKNREKLKGKTVIWFICLENDLAENLRITESDHYTNPFLRKNGHTGNWEIVTSHIQSDKWLYGEKKSHNTLRFAKICTPSAYSDRVFSACEYLIQQAKEMCLPAGAELQIFTIPDKRQLTKFGLNQLEKRLNFDPKFNPDLPDVIIEQICNRLNIPFLSGKSHLNIEDYKIRDGHWNKKGNQKVSDLVFEYYQKNIPVVQDV